jgi:hypothetical protein
LTEEYQIGRIIQHGSYISSTIDINLVRNYAGPHGIIVKYHVINGKYISRYSPLALNSEVIMSPNMEFIITKAPYFNRKDGYYYAKAVQILHENFIF